MMNQVWLWLVLTGWLTWSTASAQPPQIRDVSDFYAPLSQHGYWVHHPHYGWCWRPQNVGRDWRPYSVGRWIWTEHGWYWDSPEPWAWACYHYGRWFWDDRHGWLWMPGTEWAPAWVEWRETEAYIGWAPSPPVVHIITGPPVIVAPSAFVFVERRVFCEPDLSRWIIHHHWHHHTVIYRQSRCAPPPCCGRDPCRCSPRPPACERPRDEPRRSSDGPVRDEPRRVTDTPAREVSVVRTAPTTPAPNPTPAPVPSAPKHRRLETSAPVETPIIRVSPHPVTSRPVAEPVKVATPDAPAHRRWESRPQVYRPLTPATANEPQPSYVRPNEKPVIPRVRHESPPPPPQRPELPPRPMHRREVEKRDSEKFERKFEPTPAVVPVATPPVVIPPAESKPAESDVIAAKPHRRFSAGR